MSLLKFNLKIGDEEKQQKGKPQTKVWSRETEHKNVSTKIASIWRVIRFLQTRGKTETPR